MLLANKPAGLLTQKAQAQDYSLNEWLTDYLLAGGKLTEEELSTFRPSVCNRLDRNTSGLVICGKTLAGSQKMSELIRDRNLHKFYRLFVAGKPPPKDWRKLAPAGRKQQSGQNLCEKTG